MCENKVIEKNRRWVYTCEFHKRISSREPANCYECKYMMMKQREEVHELMKQGYRWMYPDYH
jgi:hypothetical protein